MLLLPSAVALKVITLFKVLLSAFLHKVKYIYRVCWLSFHHLTPIREDGDQANFSAEKGEFVQTCIEVNRIKEEIESGRATAEISSPPPVVVLRTEVEVAEEDGCFSTRDHQDQEHDKQKPEHVVDLVCPGDGRGVRY